MAFAAVAAFAVEPVHDLQSVDLDFVAFVVEIVEDSEVLVGVAAVHLADLFDSELHLVVLVEEIVAVEPVAVMV